MADDQNDKPNTEETPEGQPAEGTEGTEGTEGAEGAGADKDKGGDELPPEVMRRELEKARKEAADRRVAYRELEKKLEGAKTPEEHEAALKELRESNARLERNLLVRDIADTHKLPAELRDVLKGDTKEELEAHAKVLAKFAPAEESGHEDLSGGLNPSQKPDPDADNPAALAKKLRKR